MIWAPENRQFFQKLLGATDLVKTRKLQKALKSFGENSTLFFPQYLLECGYLERDPALELFRSYARQELFRVLTETGWAVSFAPGRIDLQPLAQKIEDWRFHVELEPLVIEAARQVGAEQIFQGVFPSDRDVLVPIQRTASAPVDAVPRAAIDSRRRDIQPLADGTRDVGEIVAAAATGRFDTLLALSLLERESAVRRATVADLLALADVSQKSGRIDKCQRLLLRAQELGADGFDLPLRIARNYELTGAIALAIEQYLAHAQRCAEARRDEDSIQCLRRVATLKPEEIRARTRLIELLEQQGRLEELSAEHRALAEVHAKLGETAKAAESLERMVSLGRFSDEVLSELANLWSALPDEGGARGLAVVLRRLRALSGRFLEANRKREAIRVLEFALAEQGFDPDAVVTLATTLEAEGRVEEASEQYQAIAQKLLRGEARLAGGEAAAARVLESLLRLRPENCEVRAALVERYRALDDREKAVAHLRELLEHYDRSREVTARSRTLEALASLEPEVEAHRVALAESYLADEKRDLGLRTLLDVASSRAKVGQAAGAREIAEAVLQIDPIHPGANRLVLELDRAEGRRSEATLRLRHLADVCRLRGEHDEAERLSLELWRVQPDDPRLLLGLAEIYEVRGDRKKLEGTLAELLRQSLKAQNFGFARQASARLKTVNPSNPILRDAVAQLESATAGGAEEEIARRVRDIEATLERQVRVRIAEEMRREPPVATAIPEEEAAASARRTIPAVTTGRAPAPDPEPVAAPEASPKTEHVIEDATVIEERTPVAVAVSAAVEAKPAAVPEASPWSTVRVQPESIHGILEKLRSLKGDG